jgi:pimeloyl-ACP methyl ester carboxylesterase
VVRYDHRCTGLSDWDPPSPYALADMAGDGRAVLDALQLRRAHVVGVSMGGMIAQEFALAWPERTQTLTSMMSSADIEARDLPPISSQVAYELIKVALKYGVIGGEANLVKMHVASRMVLRGEARYALDVPELAQAVLYNLRERRGYNPRVSPQHQAAVRASGSRRAALATLRVPTLVIHGRDDPFIPIEHGKECARLIPGAVGLWVGGMGHDIASAHEAQLVEALVAHFARGSEASDRLPD